MLYTVKGKDDKKERLQPVLYGGIKMKHFFVKFSEADQMIKFVRIISRYDYDAFIKCDSRIVDAKSIIGVLSIATSKTLEVILNTENCDDLIDQLAPFAA